MVGDENPLKEWVIIGKREQQNGIIQCNFFHWVFYLSVTYDKTFKQCTD